MSDSIAERLDKALKAAGESARGASLKAGLSQSAAGDILSGKALSPRASTIRALAAVLNVSAAYLLTGEVELKPATEFDKEVRLLGQVAAGVWREALEWPPDEQSSIIVPKPSHDWQGLFALRVEGDSMNLKFPAGTVLVCASVFHNPEMGLEDGDYVIVERRKQDSDLMEATVKSYRIIDGAHWLYPESSKPEHAAPIPLPGPNGDDLDGAERDQVQITARVVQAILDL